MSNAKKIKGWGLHVWNRVRVNTFIHTSYQISLDQKFSQIIKYTATVYACTEKLLMNATKYCTFSEIKERITVEEAAISLYNIIIHKIRHVTSESYNDNKYVHLTTLSCK